MDDRILWSGIMIVVIMMIYQFMTPVHKSNLKVTTPSISKLRRKTTAPTPEIIKLKQNVYTDILRRTKKALDKLSVPFFLSSGTCLGYFREGKFIDYDYDIDVGIFAKHYTPKIVTEMKKQGLELYRVLGTKKTGMELSFRLPGTDLGRYAKIDIFLHYFEKDKKTGKNNICWFSYIAPKFKKQVKYRVPEFKIKEVNFMGVNVFVPYPTIEYIENHYGEDWMVPRKPFVDYVYYSSPKSVVKS